MKMSKSWFYPVTNKSKHEVCLNYGDSECCHKCHEEWCLYSRHEETKDIMIRDTLRYNTSKQTNTEEGKET